jgi:hypothetical protein
MNAIIMKTISRFLVLALALLPAFCFAHPGHGPVDHGPAHFMLSPIHAIPLLVALVLGIGWYFSRRKKSAIHSQEQKER